MPESSGVIRAGSSQVDITPQPGIPLTGYIARAGKSTGVHDPLFASCLVLNDGNTTAAVVSCDLVALDVPMVNAIRAKIQAAIGIPEDHIMLACTHTHSGPATIFLQDCGEVDPAYLVELQAKIVTGVTRAAANLRPVHIGSSAGTLSSGTFDRRKPGAPVDPEIGVVYLCDDLHHPLAVLVNFACHPVVLDADNLLISADYPGAVRRAVQKDLNAPVLFFVGACGNIDPVKRGTFQLVDEFGASIAHEVLKLIASLQLADVNLLAIQRLVLDLPLMPAASLDELNQQVELHTRNRDTALRDLSLDEKNPLIVKVENAMLAWTARISAQIRAKSIRDHAPSEIQALSLGKVVLLGVAGEMFSTLGQEIKQHAGSLQVLVSTCTNGSAGYIPDREAYPLATYEITEAYKYYGEPSAVCPEAGELIVAEAAALIERS